MHCKVVSVALLPSTVNARCFIYYLRIDEDGLTKTTIRDVALEFCKFLPCSKKRGQYFFDFT